MRVRTGALCALGAAGLMVAGMALADGTTTNSAVPKGSTELELNTAKDWTNAEVNATEKTINFPARYGEGGHMWAAGSELDPSTVESFTIELDKAMKGEFTIYYKKEAGETENTKDAVTSYSVEGGKLKKFVVKPGDNAAGHQIESVKLKMGDEAADFGKYTVVAFYSTAPSAVTYDKTSVDGKEYAGGDKVLVPTVKIMRGTTDVTDDWTITYMLDGEAVELDNEKKVTLPNQAGPVKLSWEAVEKANADNKLASTTAQEATLNVVALKLKTRAQSVVTSSNVDLEAVVEPNTVSGYDIAFYREKLTGENDDVKLGDADASTHKYAWGVGTDVKDYTVYAKATKTGSPDLTSEKITVKVKAAATAQNKGSQTIEWTIPADKLFEGGTTLADVLTACPATLILDPEDDNVTAGDIAFYEPGATPDAAPVVIADKTTKTFTIEANKEDAEYTVIAKKAAIGDTYTAAEDVTVTIKVSKPVTSVKFPDDFAPAATAAYADIAKAKVYAADGTTEVTPADIKYWIGETEITSTTPAGWKLGGGKQTITAKYAGDATHHSSEGSKDVTVRYTTGTASDIAHKYTFNDDISAIRTNCNGHDKLSHETTGHDGKCLKSTTTAASTNAWDVQPCIELGRDLSGEKVIVKFWAKASAPFQFDYNLLDDTDSDNGWNTQAGGSAQLTTEWQQFKNVVTCSSGGEYNICGIHTFQCNTASKDGGITVWLDDIEFAVPSGILDQVDDEEHGLKNFDELPMKITGSEMAGDERAKPWHGAPNQKWYGKDGGGKDFTAYSQLIITFKEKVNPEGQYVIQYDAAPDNPMDVFSFSDTKYMSADGKVLTMPLDGVKKIMQLGGDGPEDMEIDKVQLRIRPQAQEVTWTAADDAEDDGLDGTSDGATPAVWTAKLPTKDVAHTGPTTCTVKYYIDNVEATPGTDTDKSLTLTGLGVHYVKFVSTPPDYTAANNPENKVYWATATEVYTINVTDPNASEQVIDWDDEEVELMALTAFAAEGGTPAAPLYKTAKSMTTATPAAATGNAVTYKYTTVESFDADVFDPSAATWTAVPADFKFPAGLTLVMAECAASEADNTASPTKPAYNAAVPAFRLFSATKYKSQVKWTDTDIAAKLDSTSGVYKGVEGLTAPTAGVAEKIVTAATATAPAQVEAIANATVAIKFYSCDAQYNLDDDATVLTLTGGKLPAQGASAQYILAVVTFAGDDCCEASEAQYKLSIEAASALNVVNAQADVVGVEYYNLEGQKVNANAKGLLLRVETLSNGKTQATKVLVK